MRAVADSDDEGGELSDDVGSPGVGVRGDEQSTRSTEALQRSLERAQQAFSGPLSASMSGADLKRQFDGAVGESPLQGAGVKRRKTSVGREASPREPLSQRRKSMHTYGRESRYSQSMGQHSTDGIHGLQDEENEQILEQQAHMFEADATDDYYGDGVYLPDNYVAEQDATVPFVFSPGIADDFANHEPLAMFPDVSSTVPNNTLSQQRMIQEALAENQPVSFASLRGNNHLLQQQPPGTVQSSPDWSAYMNSNPGNTTSPEKMLTSGRRGSLNSVRASGNEVSAANSKLPDLSPGSTDRKSSSKARRSQSMKSSMAPPELPSSARTKRRKTHFDDPASQDSLADELSTSTKKSTSKKATAISDLQTETSPIPQKAQRKRKVVESDDNEATPDELNSDDIAIGLVKEQYKPQPSRSRSTRADDTDAPAQPSSPKKSSSNKPTQTSSDFLDSDEIAAIGLPKEQYKPRPSRRRSNPVAEDEAYQDIDFSKIPERQVKAKARRSKTVGAGLPGRGRDLLSEKEKIEKMVEMGFDGANAKIALTNNGGKLESAVEWLSERASPGGRLARGGDINGTNGSNINNITASESKTRKGKEISKESDQSRQPEEPEAAEMIDKSAGKGQHVRKQPAHTVLPISTTPTGSPTGVAGFMTCNVEIPALKEAVHTTQSGVQRSAAEPQGDPSGNDVQDVGVQSGNNVGKKKRASAEDGELEKMMAPDQGAGADPEQAVVEPPKKRGRGRPRSKKAVEEPAVDIRSEDIVIPSENTSDPRSTPTPSDPNKPAPLKEVNPNLRLSKQSLASEHEKNDILQSTPPGQLDNTAKNPTTPVRTRERSATTDGISKAHSPLNKGKVPHRVGLSKRARIPSLLKVVRK